MQGLLGLVLAGDSAGRLGDTLGRLVRTGQRTLDRVGATLGSLVRAHEGAGHRIAAGQRNRVIARTPKIAAASRVHDCWAMCWLATASAAASMPLLCPRTKIMADTLAQ